MDSKVDRIAALANIAFYDEKSAAAYGQSAPHVRHDSVRRLYGELVVEVFDYARRFSEAPTVLDLGAGEGSVTLPFLELGAKVTAVDISREQLDVLEKKCASHSGMIEVRCEDIHRVIEERTRSYDIIAANSFMHHVPDYLSMIGKAVGLLARNGQFFSFQDPLRYDSLGTADLAFSKLAYISWRLTRGDVAGGIGRRLRRSRGIYLQDAVEDNTEYHVVRNGVDQEAIEEFFRSRNFDCRIIRYFSTQSGIFQRLGDCLGRRNTFAVIARKNG